MPLYELRSFRAPILRGHTPEPLEPAPARKALPMPIGHRFDGSYIYEDVDQDVPGTVQPVEKALVIDEANRLFSNPECWHITINEFAKDAAGVEHRSAIHWCASVEQVQAWLDEG